MAPAAPAAPCLYLGRDGDPDTVFLQPHAAHRCYATAPESRIDLDRQRRRCFGDCEGCSRYVAPLAPGRRGRPRPVAPAAEAQVEALPSAGAAAEPAGGLVAWLRRLSFEEAVIYLVTAGLLAVIGWFALVARPSEEKAAALPASLAETATVEAGAVATDTPTPRSSPTTRPTTAAEAAPAATAELLTPPPGGLIAALSPSERGVGSFSASGRVPDYGVRELRVGHFAEEPYLGGLLFPLSKIPPTSRVSYVALELAGLSDSQVLPEGEWIVELLDPEPAEAWADLTYESLDAAPATQMQTVWRLRGDDLAARKVNVLEFSADARDLFMQRLEQGRIAFRIRGPEAVPGVDNLFIWDTGYGEGFGTRPVLRVAFTPPTATPTPPGQSSGGGAPKPTDLPLLVWIGNPTPAPAAPTATPFPSDLYDTLSGMILFVSDRFAVPEGKAPPPSDYKRPAGFTQAEQLMVYDPRTGRIGQVTQTWPWELAKTLAARGGDVSVSVGPQSELLIRDQYSEGPRLLGVNEGDNYDPSVSPDGEWVVFVSNRHHNDEIYKIRRNGEEISRLTENTWEWDKGPSFSPDGKQIVFWSNRDGHNQIYIMNADGSDLRNISNNAYNDWNPVWVR